MLTIDRLRDALGITRDLAFNDGLHDLLMYANDLRVEPRPGEDETEFARRVTDLLRDRGQVGEAHEVLQGRRFDAPGSRALDGVIGHMADTLADNPPRRVIDEPIAGILASRPDTSAGMRGALDALGPDAFFGLLGGGR